MIKFIFQDWEANTSNTKGRIILVLFRLANYTLYNKYAALILLPYVAFYKFFVTYFLGVEIPYDLAAGGGLVVFHGHALVVHSNTRIGVNCTLRQSTTIGNNGRSKACPIIGNDVNIGANVCIIGGVTIGDRVTIGAGSVVVKSIPADAVAAGNPARIIKQTELAVS